MNTIKKTPILGGHAFIITTDSFDTLISCKRPPTWVQTCMLISTAIGFIRFPIGVRLCEDLNFMLQIYENVVSAFITDILVLVRRHENNSYSSAHLMIVPSIKAFYDVKT